MRLIKKLRNNKLAKSGINYSLSSTSLSAISIVVSLLNMRWLGPSELGVWQSLTIFSSYIPFLQLGIQSGLNLELPILLGNNDEKKLRSYIANAYFFSWLVTFIILCGGLFAAVLVGIKGMGPKYVFGVIALTGLNVGTSIAYHFIARYRSSMAFDILSEIIRLQILTAVFCIPLIYYFHYWGLLVYNSVPILIYAILMYIRSPFNDVKPAFTKNDSIYLIKRGTIQMCYVQTSTAIKTIQQWFLLHFGSTVYVGLFSPALAIGSIINMIPGQLNQFLVPQMGYKYGQTKKARDLWPFVKKFTLIAPFVILPISLSFYFVLPWLITTFFTKYVESIRAMQIMSLGFIFSAASNMGGFLYTIKAYKEATVIIATEFVSYLIFPSFFYLIAGLPILKSLALGVTCAFFCIYICTFVVLRITLFKPVYNK